MTKIRIALTLILIPVIDLAQGRVVHARRGVREAYQPLRSRLCRSCEPAEVIAGLLRLHGFSTLYIADLDAIQRLGDQTAVIEALREQFPHLDIWIDPGIDTRARYEAWRHAAPGVPVLGSETLVDPGLLADILAADGLLSLDFEGDTLLGPLDLLERPEHWPRRVIVMCLDRVGADTGPDTKRLQQLRRLSPGAQLYAAGGVRNLDDLLQLRQLGVTGALLASALHEGRIGPTQIAALA
jgi:phosphoribosylformimino-5-aminoimidazole carboxamide ribotide isomerase